MEELVGAVKMLAVCVLLHGCMTTGSKNITMGPSVAEQLGMRIGEAINRQTSGGGDE